MAVMRDDEVTDRIRQAFYALYAFAMTGVAITVSHAESLAETVPLSASLFALATAGCILACIRPTSKYFWAVSGVCTAAASTWRIVVLSISAIQDQSLYDRSVWFMLTPTAGWLLVLFGAWAVWTRITRPGGVDG